jgi:hypothetical protein
MRAAKWRNALIEEIERSQRLPFEYGKHDCLQFVARCVLAITGTDHAVQFGSYTDPAEILKEHGGVDGILTEIFGEPKHPSEASDGDVVLAEIGGRESAGVCMGGKFLFVRDTGGLVAIPRKLIRGCWTP